MLRFGNIRGWIAAEKVKLSDSSGVRNGLPPATPCTPPVPNGATSKSSAVLGVTPAKSKLSPFCAAKAVQLAMRLVRSAALTPALMFAVVQGSVLRKLANTGVRGAKFSPRFGARSEVLKLLLKVMSRIGR